MAEGGGFEKMLSEAAQAAGDKIVEIAAAGAQRVAAGLGALLAMIPGVGEGLSNAVASVGRGDTPMVDGHVASAPATPTTPVRAQSVTPAVEQSVEAPVKTITLPAQAFAMVEAIKNNPVSLEWASPNEALTGTLARAATPGVQQEQQLGGRSIAFG